MRLGLLGFPLGHSFSMKYFNEKFSQNKKYEGWSYENFEREDVYSFFKNEAIELDGFNVTIPHKKNVLPFLDSISEEAMEIGAVNCVKNIKGKFHGYNTDAYGFEESLRALFEKGGFTPKCALILGSGGASMAARYVLKKMNIAFDIVSRNGKLNYQNLGSKLRQTGLIVNTTPVGMFPMIEDKPELDYSILTENQYLYDLIYNPEKTSFLLEGEKKGCMTKSGLEMLYLQAEKNLEIWTS